MIPPSRILRRFALLAVVSLTVAACSSGERPAAVVGGVEISHARLASDVPLYQFLSGLSGSPCGTPVEGESEQAACTRFTLANDIREELVKAYAATNDVTVPRDDIDTALLQLEENLGGEEPLRQRLAEDGLVRSDLVSLARRLLLFNAVQRALADERLTDEAIQELYDQNRTQFTTVEASHILLESQQQARKIAGEATPENFAELARERSTDTASAENGGSLGSFSESQFASQFDPDFVDAALALQPGEVSGPVETQFGWHVILLQRRDVAPLEDVRDQLTAQQGSQLFDEWLRGRVRDVEIEVNPRYGRLDRSSGEILPVKSTSERSSPAADASPSAPAVSPTP